MVKPKLFCKHCADPVDCCPLTLNRAYSVRGVWGLHMGVKSNLTLIDGIYGSFRVMYIVLRRLKAGKVSTFIQLFVHFAHSGFGDVYDFSFSS